MSASSSPSRRTGAALGATLLASAVLAGCATTDARRMATAGAPAWELRGASLEVLDQQAQRLCPQGHEVVQQWESFHEPDAGAGLLQRSLARAAGWMGAGPHDEARLVVQCKA